MPDRVRARVFFVVAVTVTVFPYVLRVAKLAVLRPAG